MFAARGSTSIFSRISSPSAFFRISSDQQSSSGNTSPGFPSIKSASMFWVELLCNDLKYEISSLHHFDCASIEEQITIKYSEFSNASRIS